MKRKRDESSVVVRPHLYTSGLMVAAVSGGFYLLMQAQIVRRIHWRHDALVENLREAVWLVFSQNQNLLVAGLFGGLWLLAARRLSTRRLFVGLFSLTLLYLVINQLAYGVLLDHLQFETGEERKLSALRLLDSAASLVDSVFLFNLLLWLLITAALARRLLPEQGATPAPPWLRELRRNGRFYGFLLVAFIGFNATTSSPLYNYADHPLLELARSAVRVPAGLADIPYDPELDIDSLAYGT
ncbi:MAG: hypothetical protein ACQETD_12125, partial [Pseudomonadota bacterium]